MIEARATRAGVAVSVGRLAGGASRVLRFGDGTVIGGRAALLADPSLVERWARGRGALIVSGTNGKTTTTTLLAEAMRSFGDVATNAAGANLAGGVAAAVIERWGAPTAVVEVDEAVVPWAVRQMGHARLVLLNLSRDQLDRLHEVHATAAAWRAALASAPRVHVIANADDPLVVWAAQPAETTWVAVGQPWRLDAGTCPECRGRIEFDADRWWCRRCGLRRPPLDAELDGDELVTGTARRHLGLSLPGRCNRSNAAMALVAALSAGVSGDVAMAGWERLHSVGPRFARTRFGASTMRLLLAKNPAGWLEILELLEAGDTRPVIVALNARREDGTDPSWVWDVPFERLSGRPVVCTGERAADLAVRLTYSGVAHDYRPDIDDALHSAEEPEIDVVANYSAFRIIARRLARAA